MLKKTKQNDSKQTTISLHNATENNVEINGKVVEPDEAVTLPAELETEAREKGLA